MSKTTIQQFFLFILLVVLQVGLFNNIHLFGILTPFVYIYFTLKLPVKMNRNIVLIFSALIGLVIDLFESTLGLNMFVMVIIGFLRFYLLKLFAPRDVFEDYVPSFETFGNFMFIRYVGMLTFIHIAIIYFLESFKLEDPVNLALRILGSLVLTVLIIFAFESINIRGFKR